MVMEGLNPWRDHPGMLLTKMPHAFEMCRAVDSPSCKILRRVLIDRERAAAIATPVSGAG